MPPLAISTQRSLYRYVGVLLTVLNQYIYNAELYMQMQSSMHMATLACSGLGSHVMGLDAF